MSKITLLITPVPKPRMTQRDKWLKPARKCVADYWDFKNSLGMLSVEELKRLPAQFDVDFYLPMPAGWSEKRKSEMEGKPHQQRPDRDNLVKSLQDCLCDEDGYIYNGRVGKWWSREGKIIIDTLT